MPILCDDLPGDCCEDCHDEALNRERPFVVLTVWSAGIGNSGPTWRAGHATSSDDRDEPMGYSCCIKAHAVVRAVEEAL